MNSTETMISHCTMSFEGMSRMLGRKRLGWPFLAMSRVCMESAIRVNHVLADGTDPDRRLMRMAALLLWSDHESTKAMRATPMPKAERAEAERVSAERAAMLDAEALRIGFLIDRTNRLPVVRHLSGAWPPEGADLNMVDAAERLFPDIGGRYYRLTSGFIHGAPWALAHNRVILKPNLQRPAIDEGQMLDATLLVTAAVARTLGLSSLYAGIPHGLVQRRVDRLLSISGARR